MAGDWIVYTKDLPTKREVMHISRSMGMERREVVAVVMEVWAWADAETDDGYVTGLNPSDIDDVVSIEGFGQAMLDADWLETDAGGICFPNFTRWHGKSAKRRLRNAKRQQRYRNRQADGATP